MTKKKNAGINSGNSAFEMLERSTIMNFKFTPFSFAPLQVNIPCFHVHHHFPELQISNPTEVLVSSDIRPYQNFTFYDV